MRDVTERIADGGEPIEGDDDRRFAPTVGCSTIHLVGEAPEQTREAFDLRDPHHSATVRNRLDGRPRNFSLGVHDVQVHQIRCRRPSARGDHPQRGRRRAGPDRADQEQVAVARRPEQWTPALVGGIVEHTDRSAVVGEISWVDHGG